MTINFSFEYRKLRYETRALCFFLAGTGIGDVFMDGWGERREQYMFRKATACPLFKKHCRYA